MNIIVQAAGVVLFGWNDVLLARATTVLSPQSRKYIAIASLSCASASSRLERRWLWVTRINQWPFRPFCFRVGVMIRSEIRAYSEGVLALWLDRFLPYGEKLKHELHFFLIFPLPRTLIRPWLRLSEKNRMISPNAARRLEIARGTEHEKMN